MGTNYYVLRCNEPLREDGSIRRTHLGKSSGGWCFALHVYPTRGLGNWPAWKKYLVKNASVIVDEYGGVYLFEDFRKIVEERRGIHNFQRQIPNNMLSEYTSWKRFFEVNYAKPGPNGLVRADPKRSSLCLGNGRGTYDYFVGEFS